MNNQNDGIGFGVSRGAVVAIIVLVIIVLLTWAGVLPAHGDEPGQIDVCSYSSEWDEWSVTVFAEEEMALALAFVAANPPAFITDSTDDVSWNDGCPPGDDNPFVTPTASPPTAQPPTATATVQPSPTMTATATTRPTATATSPPLPTAQPTLPPTVAPTVQPTTVPPTATPVPPPPACPSASVTARVGITGMLTLVNSTGTSVGPFALTVTTTSGVGVVVRFWPSVTARARATTIVGPAFDGMAAMAMGRWFSIAKMGGAWCEPLQAGDGFRSWFPVVLR